MIHALQFPQEEKLLNVFRSAIYLCEIDGFPSIFEGIKFFFLPISKPEYLA